MFFRYFSPVCCFPAGHSTFMNTDRSIRHTTSKYACKSSKPSTNQPIPDTIKCRSAKAHAIKRNANRYITQVLYSACTSVHLRQDISIGNATVKAQHTYHKIHRSTHLNTVGLRLYLVHRKEASFNLSKSVLKNGQKRVDLGAVG